MTHAVDEVLIALPIRSCYQQIEEAVHTCAQMGVQSTYLTDIIHAAAWAGSGLRHEHAFPMQTVKVVQDDGG